MTDISRELTPKQRKFCEHVGMGYNWADSYRAAFDAGDMSVQSICNAALKLRRNPHVTNYIQELEVAAAKGAKISREWVLRWHWMRATYDANELAQLTRGACPCCYGDGHLKQWRMPDYMEAVAQAERDGLPLPDIAGGLGYNATLEAVPDCPGCDGKGLKLADFPDTRTLSPAAQAAFEGVKRTRDGIEIKMADKHAAMEALSKLCGFNVADALNPADLPDADDVARMPAVDAARVYQRIMGGNTKH